MTYMILYKDIHGKKHRIEMDSDKGLEKAMYDFLEAFSKCTIYHIIPIPVWED